MSDNIKSHCGIAKMSFNNIQYIPLANVPIILSTQFYENSFRKQLIFKIVHIYLIVIICISIEFIIIKYSLQIRKSSNKFYKIKANRILYVLEFGPKETNFN